ncbi:hypothetical protein LWC34_19800 [Kibdelosporangium philippinense]|uniref:Transposase DDE domain-containing protein n=1 Tax=Kibdelosporangium philippinense TaxID=211113 RepID=A0ABS8ZB18_9PSEU|nr:hypothetical protein [Kibdelosporangium philippinense]MCE7005054.1 hypothetical protein [Kibdelosporangium philippinense]
MNAAAAAEILLGDELVAVSDAEVDRARAYIDQTGLVEFFTTALADRRRSPAGRPRTLTIEALLVGLLLTAVTDRTVLLSGVNMLVHHRISPRFRQQLGVPDRPLTANAVEASYAVVRRLFHAIVEVFDDSPNPKNRRWTEAEFAARLTPMTLGDQARRRECRDWVSNRVLAPSLTGMLDILRAYPATGSCVDATPIKTHARKPSRTSGIVSADPDAGLYLRTNESKPPATHQTSPNNTVKHKTSSARVTQKVVTKKIVKELYGYEATLLVNGSTRPVDGRIAPPVLVGGYTLERPGHRPGAAATDVLRHAIVNGWPTGLLAGDRAYNNSDPDTFQLPARALGFGLVFDYRDDQLGVQAEHGGAIQVEGHWHCPHMPTPLVETTRHFRDEHHDEATWRRHLAARAAYELRPKASPDAEGHQRMLCPAAGPAPTVRCPLKKPSMRHTAKPTVNPAASPVEPPQICSQQSITVPPQAGAKHGQALPYASPEWGNAYHTLRNGVEGTNGYLKDPTNTNLESSGTRRVRGIAAVSFLVGFQLAASNLRKHAHWRHAHPIDPEKPPQRRARRRSTRPLTEWAPASAEPERHYR